MLLNVVSRKVHVLLTNTHAHLGIGVNMCCIGLVQHVSVPGQVAQNPFSG